MKLTQCRNAMLVIEYAGRKFLIDPVFAEKGTYPPFPSIERADVKNPLHDLPFPADTLAAVDAVIVTHLHPDHFDEEAKQRLDKRLPVFVQNAADCDALLAAGFRNVTVLGEQTAFGDVRLSRTEGRHGYDEAIAQRLGPVCGVVLQSEREKTLYIAGDTVWCEPVAQAIARYAPSVIVLNAGGNSARELQLIMGKHDVLRVHEAAPAAQLVAVHMEAYNHWTVSREALRAFAEEHGFAAALSVPEDGESAAFA